MLIILDKKSRQEGVEEYLANGEDGKRDEKDIRIPLYGDLDILSRNNEIGKRRGYKEVYRNIVLSFAETEISEEKMRAVAEDFISEYLAGYDIEAGEAVVYAEAHIPKPGHEYNSRGERRHPHIHICICTYSPRLRRQLKLSNHRARMRELSLLKEYLEQKHGLEPSDDKRRAISAPTRRESRTQSANREEIEEYILSRLSTYRDLDDMIRDLRSRFGHVKIGSSRAKTPYISIRPRNGKRAIRLRGMLYSPKNFAEAKEALLKQKRHIHINIERERKSAEEIYAELEAERRRRIEYIENWKKEVYRRQAERKERWKEQKRQEAFFMFYNPFARQSTAMEPKIWGFFVKRVAKDIVVVKNRKRGVNIVDRGEKIVARGDNLREQAKLMVEMAIAKNWDLRNIRISGPEEFVQIAREEIARKLKEIESAPPLVQKQIEESKPQPGNLPERKLEDAREGNEILRRAKKINPHILLPDFSGNAEKRENGEWRIFSGGRKLSVVDYLLRERGMCLFEAVVYLSERLREIEKEKQTAPRPRRSARVSAPSR